VSAVHNEQTKLLATALNNIAVAFVVIGFVTPITAMSFGVASAPSLRPTTAFFAAIWLSTGIGIHSIGRRVLRSIKP
jgi:ABC-type multidrug transport system permease subunit